MDYEAAQQLSETVKEHAERPRNYGPLKKYNAHHRWTGPCGDTMEYWLQIEAGRVVDLGFITDGCETSIASGSMTGTMAAGRSVEQVMQMDPLEIYEALDGLPDEFQHCILLALTTVQDACEVYLTEQEELKARQTEPLSEEQRLKQRMGQIRHKIAVFSGKGGVGKSTVAVNLASSLALEGYKVGLLDSDIHGPSVPTMLGLEGVPLEMDEDGVLPLEVDGIKVMSLGLMLESQDDAVIWRGPRKLAVIKQFVSEVAWGELDYLIIDSPPGTGDEPLAVCQTLNDLDGAVIVTTPQKVAAVDVRKSISFCRQVNVPVLGVVENMSGYVCPKCGDVTQILAGGAGQRIAEDMQVPFLGAVPIDPQVALAGDSGQSFVRYFADSPTAAILRDLFAPLLRLG